MITLLSALVQANKPLFSTSNEMSSCDCSCGSNCTCGSDCKCGKNREMAGELTAAALVHEGRSMKTEMSGSEGGNCDCTKCQCSGSCSCACCDCT